MHVHVYWQSVKFAYFMHLNVLMYIILHVLYCTMIIYYNYLQVVLVLVCVSGCIQSRTTPRSQSMRLQRYREFLLSHWYSRPLHSTLGTLGSKIYVHEGVSLMLFNE